jgi:hypothetical protein
MKSGLNVRRLPLCEGAPTSATFFQEISMKIEKLSQWTTEKTQATERTEIRELSLAELEAVGGGAGGHIGANPPGNQ